MELETGFRRNRRILWGVFLIALGGIFLFERAGWVDLPNLSHWWPAVLVVIGVGRLLERRPGAGAMLVLLGLAFFAAELRWLGLSYRNFWPLLLVAVGVGIVVRALSGEESGCVARGTGGVS